MKDREKVGLGEFRRELLEAIKEIFVELPSVVVVILVRELLRRIHFCDECAAKLRALQ